METAVTERHQQVRAKERKTTKVARSKQTTTAAEASTEILTRRGRTEDRTGTSNATIQGDRGRTASGWKTPADDDSHGQELTR